MNLTSPLMKAVHLFEEAAVSPPSSLKIYATAALALPLIPVTDAGETAVGLVAAGQRLVRQMPHVTPDGLPALRDALTATTRAIYCEIEARGGVEGPYYVG